MTVDLERLRIDRSSERTALSRSRAPIVVIIVLGLLLGAAGLLYHSRTSQASKAGVAPVVEPRPAEPGTREAVLNATGYVIAAHKIEVASKVIGKVAWIGVERGDRVSQGQPLVRLEDDEYRAQVLQAEGNLENLEAKLAALEHGSRPEEIARAKADVDSARADLDNYRVNLERWKQLARDGIASRQTLDDAEGKYDNQAGKVVALERIYELTRLGPRKEEIDAARALVKQALGALEYARSQLENTVIRAPVSGTILERNVEKGEFVTTGFVGERGAKGYVVSLADLNDLEVEVDINQNDFARLRANQPAVVTTDAYPDRKYPGFICEMSPEANRQKATVQVKVRIERPDRFLRPDMNAAVAFREAVAGGGEEGETR
jgi:HlyD family secretion protein